MVGAGGTPAILRVQLDATARTMASASGDRQHGARRRALGATVGVTNGPPTFGGAVERGAHVSPGVAGLGGVMPGASWRSNDDGGIRDDSADTLDLNGDLNHAGGPTGELAGQEPFDAGFDFGNGDRRGS